LVIQHPGSNQIEPGIESPNKEKGRKAMKKRRMVSRITGSDHGFIARGEKGIAIFPAGMWPRFSQTAYDLDMYLEFHNLRLGEEQEED